MYGSAVVDVELCPELGPKLVEELAELREVVAGAEEAVALAEELLVAQLKHPVAGLADKEGRNV